MKSRGIATLIAGYGSAEAAAKGLNFILVLGLASLVDLNNYGVISLIIAIELVLTELIVAGQHTALLRFYEAHRNSLHQLYSASLVIVLSVSFTTILLSALLPLGDWGILNMGVQNSDLLFICIGVALQCQVALYLAHLRSADEVMEYGVIRVGYQSVKLVAVVCAVLILREASAYPIGVLAANTLVFLVLLRRINRRTQAYSRIRELTSTLVKQNAQLGLPLTAHTMLVVLHSIVDRFFIERILSADRLAVYGFAAVQGTTLFFVVNVLALAYVPKIFRGKEYNHETQRTLSDFLRVSSLGALLLAIVVYFLIYPLSLLFVAPEYGEGRQVLALALATAITYPLSAYGLYKLTLLRRVGGVPFITFAALVVNVALNWVLVPRYGIEGAAAASLVSHTLYALAMVLVASLLSKENRIV